MTTLSSSLAARAATALSPTGLTIPDGGVDPDAIDPADGFLDDGLTPSGPVMTLSPVGRVVRPNGMEYVPRTIGGHEDLAFLRAAREQQEHVLFIGPPGTGKTALAEAAFTNDATDEHPGFESIVCGADTTDADFLGTWVQDPTSGRFVWVAGPLQRAVEANVPLYVDEVFLADARVLSSVLYPLMDGRRVLNITANPELPPIEVRSGFFVIAAGNPDVPGAVFSDALRDRFVHHIEVTTDWALAKQLKVPSKMVTIAKNLDAQRQRGEIGWSPQLRTLLAYRDACLRFGEEFAARGLVSKAPEEDRAIIAKSVRSALGEPFSKSLSLGGRHRA